MCWPNRAAPQAIPLHHALALGALQGPTELLPVSSSAHLTLLPWLLRWNWTGIDAEQRKTFEVAVHAGAAPAVPIVLRDKLSGQPAASRSDSFAELGLSLAPSVVVGYVFERRIERQLRNPWAVAVGLLAGGLALAWADRSSGTRHRDEAGRRDAAWLGLAQACALFPGVSRGGATLAAARIRGFARADAHRLSRELALPVIVGAAVLKGARLRARRLRPEARAPFLVGAVAAFLSTLASKRLLVVSDGDRPLWPYAAYRVALAAAIFRSERTLHPSRR
ncbi:MAG: undecaprenyl-diphosphate phosphatase [Solirubrobacterales bacterium]|nr:undecaprenyl-diphosphate phosphatase [Solirubrobacterales bacterium]